MKIVVLIFMICLPSIILAQTWQKFNNKEAMFTASYPSNWANKIKEGGRVFFTSAAETETDFFYENVNVGVSTNPEFGVSYKIKDVAPELLKTLQNSVTLFKQEKLNYFTWNGSDALEIVYSGYPKNDDKLKVRVTQWLCFYKTRLYTVTYTAEAAKDLHTKSALKIMNSIVFK